ncbi:MAG: RluA family pseudouridine synthase [Paludibacteraceae bacterium]|nr:RluA family pseudouridine synthase [Paludibacteraceae bacterium]
MSEDESEELWERWRCEVDKGQTPIRIDKYLAEHMAGTSRNRIQNAADAGNVWVNKRPVNSNYKVKPGDVIQVLLDHEPHDFTITPENIPIDVVYEDEDVLVVNKPAGLVVHPGHGNYEHTLLHALAYYFGSMDRSPRSLKEYGPLTSFAEGGKSIDINDPNIGLVHRIDKDTSGLLLIAKTPEAKTSLGLQFFEHTTERTYNALVWGTFTEDSGTVEGALARDLRDRTMYRIWDLEDNPNAKEAVTHWRVLERFQYVTLVECRLETGRTHQIRVHMKSIGHPLFADEKYGGTEILKGLPTQKYKQYIQNCFALCPRQVLHAKTLGFTHPRTGKRMFFDSPLPEDMSNLLEKWRNYVPNTLG